MTITHEGVAWGGTPVNQRGARGNFLTLTITILSFGVSESRPIPTLEGINSLTPARNFDLDIYLRSSFPTLEAFKEGVAGLPPPPVIGLNEFYLQITNPFLNSHCGGRATVNLKQTRLTAFTQYGKLGGLGWYWFLQDPGARTPYVHAHPKASPRYADRASS